MGCSDARLLLSRALDGALDPRSSAALAEHLRDCHACQVYRRELEQDLVLLGDLWALRSAPHGFAPRVTSMLPPRRATRPWRWPAVAAAALLAVALAAAVVQPTAWASLGLFLRQVVLRESAPPAIPLQELPISAVSLDEAQRRVAWQIRQPSSLPDGYRLAAVYAGALHAGADGESVVLRYQQGDGQSARRLEITQLRARSEISEPVEPGAASRVPVGADSGLFIDGRWVEGEGGRTWERGTLVRLVVEQDDLVVQLQADPRQGWDAASLAAVAASLR
jgi:hypothetical protein